MSELPAPVERYRFRPAHPVVAGMAALLGAGLLAAGLAAGSGAATLVAGGLGLTLGLLYFASPAWRTEVRVDDDGLEVLTRGDRRFRLAWGEVVRVLAAPASRTAFVDGGGPSRSLLLPGRGARAPYKIENQGALYDALVARVAPERVVAVERLGRSTRTPTRSATPEAATAAAEAPSPAQPRSADPPDR